MKNARGNDSSISPLITTVSNCLPKKKKNNPTGSGIANMIKSVIDLCNSNSKEEPIKNCSNIGGDKDALLADKLSLLQLCLLIEQHKLYFFEGIWNV